MLQHTSAKVNWSDDTSSQLCQERGSDSSKSTKIGEVCQWEPIRLDDSDLRGVGEAFSLTNTSTPRQEKDLLEETGQFEIQVLIIVDIEEAEVQAAVQPEFQVELSPLERWRCEPYYNGPFLAIDIS